MWSNAPMQTPPIGMVLLHALLSSMGQAQSNVRIGTPVVTAGPLTPDQITQVVTQSTDAFRQCYADGQKREPHLAGIIAVAFSVNGGTGVVTSARIGTASTIADATTSNCVKNLFY